MYLAGRMFRAPASHLHGQTFSRTCTDLTVDTPIGTWNMVEAQPAPDLADAVECYWEGWGDIPPMVEKILPRTGIELMFNLRGDHVVRELDGKPFGADYQSGWLSGLQRRYMVIETTGGSHFVAARLKPWGAWRLLREPMREVSYQVPIVEDKPLAQALHKMVEIGESIPVELYRTVAEVLAYVYRIKGMYQTA